MTCNNETWRHDKCDIRATNEYEEDYEVDKNRKAFGSGSAKWHAQVGPVKSSQEVNT